MSCSAIASVIFYSLPGHKGRRTTLAMSARLLIGLTSVGGCVHQVQALMGTTDSFYLADNGMKVMCPDAVAGQTGEMNGETYTKQTEAQIDISNVAATRTSGITDVNPLPQVAVSGSSTSNEDFCPWDTNQVTGMRVFCFNTHFNHKISSCKPCEVTDMRSMPSSANGFDRGCLQWCMESVDENCSALASASFCFVESSLLAMALWLYLTKMLLPSKHLHSKFMWVCLSLVQQIENSGVCCKKCSSTIECDDTSSSPYCASVCNVQSCFEASGIASRAHGVPLKNMSLHFEMQTHMQAVGRGPGWHKAAVRASFDFRLPQLDGMHKSTSRGLYVDRQVLKRALEGSQPEASYLRTRLSPFAKRTTANSKDVQLLLKLLPTNLSANALKPTEKLHHDCAVVGSSHRLLECKFGKEIDHHEAVFRINDAPTKGYQAWVGAKTTYRVINNVSKRGVDKAIMLISKFILHEDVKSISRGRNIWFVFREPEPYRNLYGTFLYNGTRLPLRPTSSGFRALKFAMDLCNTTTAYGFTTEEETTYGHYYGGKSRNSGPKFYKDAGHELLVNRAHFLFFNCSQMAHFPKC